MRGAWQVAFDWGRKTVKYSVSAAALGAALAVATPAAATDISFTTTLTSSSTPICLGSCHLHSAGVSSAQTFTLDPAGAGQAVSLGSAWVDAGFGWDSDADLDLVLDFTAPVNGSSGETSALVQYLRVGGFFHSGVTGGSIIWDDPTFDFGFGGYQFELDLQDVHGWTLAASTPINGTLKLLSGPQGINPVDNAGTAGVPEPAGWMLMLSGFGLIGGLLRSQRRKIIFA